MSSVSYTPDFNVISNKDDVITDMVFDRYSSRFQFSDFKNKILIGDKNVHKSDINRSPKYKTHWPQDKEGIEECFKFLVNFYKDLDTNLQRVIDDKYDPMFIRFLCKNGAMKNHRHWECLMRNWNIGFSLAIKRYYYNEHQKYCPDAVSYLFYFDTTFSNSLYYAVGRADQHLAEDRAINVITAQQIRYQHISNDDHVLMDQLRVEEI